MPCVASATARSPSGASTTRMPMPPPPPDALTSSGNPTASPAASSPSSAPGSKRGLPGSTGTPALSAMARARALSPIAAMLSGRGPTKISPAASTARANSAFSDRKP